MSLLGPGTQRLGGNSPEAGSKPIPQLHPHWAQRSRVKGQGVGSGSWTRCRGTTMARMDGPQPQPFSLSFEKKMGIRLTFPSQAPRGSRHKHRGQACSRKPLPPSLLWAAVRRMPMGRGQDGWPGQGQRKLRRLTGLHVLSHGTPTLSRRAPAPRAEGAKIGGENREAAVWGNPLMLLPPLGWSAGRSASQTRQRPRGQPARSKSLRTASVQKQTLMATGAARAGRPRGQAGLKSVPQKQASGGP